MQGDPVLRINTSVKMMYQHLDLVRIYQSGEQAVGQNPDYLGQATPRPQEMMSPPLDQRSRVATLFLLVDVLW
jgi:hypothetical protein